MAFTPDHIIDDGVPKLYQFAPGRSEYRCEAFALASLTGFAQPNKYPDLNALASEIYQTYAGPDVTSDTNGMTKENAIDYFTKHDIAFFDIQPIVDACRASGNFDRLRLELGGMNRSGIPVLLGIDDESQLYQAARQSDGNYVRGGKLHNWRDEGLHHAIIRIGMMLHAPVTFIMDPATASPPFPFPTPVLWSDLEAAHINTAIGVMPHGIVAPPSDFSFYTGTTDGVDHYTVWPVPKPVIDTEAAISTFESIRNAYQQEIAHLTQVQQASDAAFLAALRELGAKV